ncbi:hypothetical protein H5410_064742, partial [Solanum commersonii]
SNKGTPLRPGPIDTYLHSLSDETEFRTKFGAFQRHWGIYEADGNPKYKIDFSLQDRDEYPTQAKGIVTMPKRWCMFDGDKSNMDLAKKNYNIACEEADCTKLEQGASCGELSDESKISYAFNAYFQKNKQSEEYCNFNGLGKITTINPSVEKCVFPIEILSFQDQVAAWIECQYGYLVTILFPIKLELTLNQFNRRKFKYFSGELLGDLYLRPTTRRYHLRPTRVAVTRNSAQNGNKENPVLFNYLINTLDLPISKALAVSNCLHSVISVEKPDLAVHFFKSIGFTDVQIQSTTIKPKIHLFEELGITGSDLCKLIFSHLNLLMRSLEKAMKPSIEILNKVLVNDTENGDLFRVLHRSDWVIQRSPHLINRLLVVPESELKKHVTKLLDIRFPTNSECFYMMAPSLFRTSENKIRLGLEFLLETVKLEKSTLVQLPTLLMFSMKEKVILRYQVFQLIKSKKLMKKDPTFYDMMCLTEHLFLEKDVVTKKSAQNANQENPILLNYLINTLGFPKPKAVTISDRLSWVRSVEKPKLTPKIQLLQELGITGSDLGRLLSTKAILLTRSLDKILKPSIEVLNEVLIKSTDNGDWFRVLLRCDWVIYGSPHLRLVPNISYLQSVGIVGSQLSSLLKRQPHLFVTHGSKLKKLVSELMDIGFSTDSRMLVHGLHTLSCMSQESISKKLLLIQSFGFSKSECMVMFKRAPCLFRGSEKKIRLGLEFFLETVKLQKSTLVQRPTLLMFSMKERVIPRYQVFQLITSKKLMKKDPKFYDMMCLTEHHFLEKYVSRFTENAEELLMAYKGHRLDLGEE